MKRLANYRPILFIALAFCAGIFIGGCITGLLMSILIPIASLAVGICLFFICKKHTVWILFLAFSVGVSAFLIDVETTKGRDLSGEQTITARVERTKESSGTVMFSVDGIPGYLYASGDCPDVEEGDVVRLIGDLTPVSFSFTDSYERYLFSKRVSYRVEVSEYAVTAHRPSVFQKIRQKSKESMMRYMDKDQTAFCMSLVFGDKSILSKESTEQMAGSGLSHVFAVSGMHVGFLTAILTLILLKCGVGYKWNFFVNAVVLMLYGLLTGFPSGVKRAIITYIVYSLAPLLHRKSDNLSTLSLSVIIILLTNPREVFDVGFLMSVGAFAGITFFYREIYSGIAKKLKYPPLRYLYGIACITISANVFVLPVSLATFGEFAPYSTLGNLIVLPLVTFSFACVMIVTALTLIFSGFGVLYSIIKYPIIAIDVITSWISSLPGAQIKTAAMGVAAIFYVLFFVCLSRFVLVKNKTKAVFCLLFSVLTVLFILLP